MQPQVSPFADDPTAVMGRRTLAYVIDALIGIAILFTIVALTFTTTEFTSSVDAQEACSAIEFFSDDLCVTSGSTAWVGESGDMGLLVLAWATYVIFNTLLVPGFTGWSLGKLIMGLRVVKQDTFELAGMGPNIGRGFLWIVDGFFFVGFILGLATPGHRRIGDMAAKTFVVDKSLVGVPTPVRGAGAAGASTPPPQVGYSPPPGMPVAPPPPGATPPPPAAAPPPPFTPPPPGAGQPVVSPPPPSFPAPSGPPIVASPTPAPPMPMPSPTADAPPAFPPLSDQTEPVDAVAEEPDIVEPTPDVADAAAIAPPPPPAPAPAPPVEPSRAGIDAPQWDEARNTYIQWDPELNEWMEWNEASGRWISISR